MGCNCGKNKGVAAAANVVRWKIVNPDGSVLGPFDSYIEAKREARKSGGALAAA